MKPHLHLRRPFLSMLAALALLGSTSFAHVPIGGGDTVPVEDPDNNPPTKRCSEEYENLDLQMDVLEAVEALLAGCQTSRSQAESELAALTLAKENLLSTLTELAEEAASARASIQECNETLQPRVDEAAEALRQENGLTEAQFDAMVLGCTGWSAATGRPRPNGFDPIACILGLFSSADATEALQAAARAYAKAIQLRDACTGPHQENLDGIVAEQAAAADQLGSILNTLGQVVVPDCSQLESAHAAALREVARSQDRLQGCLNPNPA